MTDLADYQNRLAKNLRRVSNWAQARGIHAFRLFDRDIPEFPLTLDLYETESGQFIHLQEVETGWKQNPAEHDQWLELILAATSQTLGLAPDQIVVKTRSRQRVRGDKSKQYLATGRAGSDLIVKEGGHRFLINLEAYLDTGLFLDHRNTRSIVEKRSNGCRFLNLFGYTGSFTVYAACGGAVSSETVDLSNTYCQWAARNLALNGIDPQNHRIVTADAMVWLRDAVTQRRQFDLIVIDPPTFSNSKKMHGFFDVQRDHGTLIEQGLRLLADDGEMYFSTNLRSFVLDSGLSARAQIVDVSTRSIPEDFRDRKIHHCWSIRHRQVGKFDKIS